MVLKNFLVSYVLSVSCGEAGRPSTFEVVRCFEVPLVFWGGVILCV